MPAPTLDYATPQEKTWRVGTLTYTRPQLVNVFFWMLWGDFCLNLMDSGVQPNVIPLQLKKYGASMATIGAVTGTVVEVMSIVMVVIISTWSDRHRGPLGRRMPFMLYATPPLAVCLIALGFSPQIAQWLQHVSPRLFGTIALGSLVIGVITTLMIAYKFFDLFPQSVYYYLFADVIPQSVMGKFVSLFRVCATAGGIFFNYFLLKHAEDNPGMICIIAGVLYLVSFGMLCLMVREGEYPPPPPVGEGTAVDRIVATAKRFARECYSLGYYWKFYIFAFFFMCGNQPFGRFLVFYGRQITNDDLAKLGKINTFISFIQLASFFVIGSIIDRLHPIRAGLIGLLLTLAATVASYFLVTDVRTYIIWITILSLMTGFAAASYGTLLPRLLPREHYGQFCSATAMLWHLGLMVAIPVCGYLIDVHGNRVIFIWLLVCFAIALGMLWILFLDWKKLGGDESYVPPSPPHDSGSGFDVLPAPSTDAD